MPKHGAVHTFLVFPDALVTGVILLINTQEKTFSEL